MTQPRTLIQILRSTNFALGIAILSVIVQSFHSFTAFYNVSSLRGTYWGVAQAVCFAVIIDLAILFYTVRKNVKVTWMAGFIMVLINCYYYYSHLGISFDLILGGLLSLVIPVSVYFYSEEIDEPMELMGVDYESVEMSGLKRQIDELQKKQELYKQMLDNREVGKYEEMLDGSKIMVQEPHAHIPQQPQTKGFAKLKSDAQETDKSLLNVIPNTDRPIR